MNDAKWNAQYDKVRSVVEEISYDKELGYDESIERLEILIQMIEGEVLELEQEKKFEGEEDEE